MYLINNGEITLNRSLESETHRARIQELFGAGKPALTFWKNEICIEELYGDLEPALRSAAEYLERSGYAILDAEVRYYGEYDGVYLWENGAFIDCPAEARALRDASDAELIRVLNERGYHVIREV